MKMSKWTLLLIMLLTINPAFSQIERMEKEISALMEEFCSIGVSIAVVEDSKIVYKNAFGYKNIEDSVLLQVDDLFRIASVSKTFVATAIMQLVEKGKLNLDDDVNNYMDFEVRNPLFPKQPITIKMLLSHRSSITDSQKWDNLGRINPMCNVDYKKCYSNNIPGSKYIYSNMNYNLLGAVIENASNKRFDKYIKRHIIKPLRLKGSFNGLELPRSSFVDSYKYNKENDSFSYTGDVFQPKLSELSDYQLGYSTTIFSPPAGMIISAGELAEYMIMHINGGVNKGERVISEESEKIMHIIPEPQNHYALSISHYKKIINGEELLGQTGGHYGFHTSMIFHPQKKYGFVVFCNGCKSEGADGHELNFDIIRILYKYIITDRWTKNGKRNR